MSGPDRITSGADGNLWFTEAFGNRIGRITPLGVVTEFSDGISNPFGITSGPDGNVWFTESTPARIGRITPAGVVTTYTSGLKPAAVPSDITTGPDGRLWFTERNSIARLTLNPIATTGDASAIATTAAGVAGTVNPLCSETGYLFEYGKTTSYGSATLAKTLPAVGVAVPVSAALGGLASGTAYHYRLVATSEGGKTLGNDRTFSVPADPPSPGGGGSGGGSAPSSGGAAVPVVVKGQVQTPSDTTGPKMGIVGRSLVVSTAGRVKVAVRCPVVEVLGCTGTVALQLSGLRVARGKTRQTQLGLTRFRAGGGETRLVEVRLSRVGRSLIRGRGRTAVRVIVKSLDASGNAASAMVRAQLSSNRSA